MGFCLLQSTDQFFLFALLWTTQYTAHSIASPAYKYSTCTCTSCPAHTTCLQPIPHQLHSSIPCHRLLQTPPRSYPATATYGKPTSPTSATLTWSRCRDVQPHPCQQFHRPLQSPAAPLTQRCSHGHPAFRAPPLSRHWANRLHVLWRNPPMASWHSRRSCSQRRRPLQWQLLRRLSLHTTATRPWAACHPMPPPQQLEIQGNTPNQGLCIPPRWRRSQYS